jgi:hypothetical protein
MRLPVRRLPVSAVPEQPVPHLEASPHANNLDGQYVQAATLTVVYETSVSVLSHPAVNNQVTNAIG